MTFIHDQNCFIHDGKKSFLLSGEIHYFRIPRELWKKHLDAAVEAGLKVVSTYIPWDWHEPAEGFFDFHGATSPERDLVDWLSICHDRGLRCIVKPGPFILAEYRGAGLPDWFLERYHDLIKMRSLNGEIVKSDGVSLFNPLFLEKVSNWFDHVMPIIRQREEKHDGPVIMIQVCNEIGVFSWLAHQADYGNQVGERFRNFLQESYPDIQSVNEVWKTDYASFAEIGLPPDTITPYRGDTDRARDYTWHLFWRRYYGDYLRTITSMVRARGISVPVYHNLPGWIYGHGYEFPVNITMYSDLYRQRSEILFGVDHIPEFVSHRNMHDDRIINDITKAMVGDKPLFAAEFQSGSREYHVVTNPREMELFYKASIANGLVGWNYYMFSQGKNAPQKGYSGDTFYWYTPLTSEGEKTSTFHLVKRMNMLIRVSENLILSASRRAEVCVLFYPPYYTTELERPSGGNQDPAINASMVRRPAYFDGLLKALQVLNIDYDMADLTQDTSADLQKYRQVWAFSTDVMDEQSQRKLVDYTENGGHLVIFPCLPERDLNRETCTVLRDAIRISPSGTEFIDSPLISILGFQDIKCANPQFIFEECNIPAEEVIARTLSNHICGFRRKLGRGILIYPGTWMGFDTEGHLPVYKALLEDSGAKLQNAFVGHPNLTIRERFTGDNRAILFIGNYFNEEFMGYASYTHPETKELVNIPFNGGKVCWPPLYAVLTPVNMEISAGLNILHCTSDILDILKQSDTLKLHLIGDRDLIGELVLEGPETGRVSRIEGPQGVIQQNLESGRLIANYQHIHQQEIFLTIHF